MRQTTADRLFFVAGETFHHLDGSFAVQLFARIAPLGLAWLRIVITAITFAIWRRPWQFAMERGSVLASDQLAMAHIPRATFARLLSALPAMATLIGCVVLDQVPGAAELKGIWIVTADFAFRRPRDRYDV